MKPLLPIICLFLLFISSGTAHGETISVSSSGSDSEQDTINNAINKASEAGGGTVYLEKGVYIVDGTVKLKSGVNLIGDSDAIIRVSPKTSQFFVGNVGIISSLGPISNITIEGFQIDGNCDELPRSYANSAPKYAHDAERAILVRAYSNKFGSNVIIRNMQIYDCFSDGIHVAFINNALVYDNFISNCQHEGVFFICVTKGELFRNRVAGICSDCLRLDNCVDNRVYDNILFSYDGDNTNGQGKHGENGLQVGDSGVSKGYDARKKPLHTKNIEIFNNTFANNGLRAIWLDAAGLEPSNNVYVHDNHFMGAKELETMGIPVDGNHIENVSYENMPSVEQSREIFDAIVMEFSESGYIMQGDIHPVKNWEKKGKCTSAYIFLAGYDGEIKFNNQSYIPKPASECAIVQYATKNLAKHPTDQETEIKLTDNEDGSLTINLKVKTKYKEKKYKTHKILVTTIKIPYWEKKSETVLYTQTYSAPSLFPELGAGLFNVTVKYYNTSYNPYTLVTVQENEKQTQFSELITFVEYKYKTTTAKEFRQIGYISKNTTGYKKTYFKETNTWKIPEGDLSHSGRQLHIHGPLDLNSLEIIVHTPYTETRVTEISYSEVRESTSTFFEKMKQLFWILLFFAPFIFSIFEEFKIVFGRIR